MDGVTIGVFGTDNEAKASLESAIAKQSEAEGMTIYTRVEAGRRVTFLDDAKFPERIQGYSRVASIVDQGFYVFPRSGKLSAQDGELAVLLDAFGVAGRIEVLDQSFGPEQARAALAGTSVGGFPVEERSSASTAIDLAPVHARQDLPSKGTLIYVDRAFSVKGVGTVALGFVLSGRVAVHDRLRAVPGSAGATIDVKGIQVSDEDFQECGRGVRVGLSLRGVEAKDLGQTNWLDDGTFELSTSLRFGFVKSRFYKQEVSGRDLHVQLPGALVPARLKGDGALLTAALASPSPVWDGMRVGVVDLNGKALRIAGGGTCKL